MSLQELQKPYPGPFSIKNNNLSLTEKKQNNIKMLKTNIIIISPDI